MKPYNELKKAGKTKTLTTTYTLSTLICVYQELLLTDPKK